jgi:tRNA (cmo5U34)-methyltransferase
MSIQKIFDAGADLYDGQRRRVIPCFHDFYQTVIDLIPFGQDTLFSFLDLGAGTGLLTAFILDVFPEATATLIDVSVNMLAKARMRFSSNKKLDFLIQDYAETALPGRYDVIASAMSIHHLQGEEKKPLYQRAFDALTCEGVFINADLIKNETDKTERKYQSMWMDWIKKAGLSEEELSKVIARMELDKPSTLSVQLQWLREIGFRDVDCYYKYYNFAVFSGRKVTDST